MNISNYDVEIENILLMLDDESKEQEWEKIKQKYSEIESKYSNNDFFKEKALDVIRKNYLKKILSLEKESDEYEFYKVILEFLGIDEYVLDSEVSNIQKPMKK